MSGSSPRYLLPLVFAASAAAAVILVAISPEPPEPPAVAPASTVSVLAGEGEGAPATSAPVASQTGDEPPPTDTPPEASAEPTGACPSDMTLVDGWFCPFVAHRCAETRRKKSPGDDEVCEAFKAEVLCEGTLERLRYCVDTFEYPNQRGVVPAVLVSFEEAERACAVEGKRLCAPRELAFACEGEDIHPYAVGERRTPDACRWDAGAEARVTPSRGAGVAAQLALVDKRLPAGGAASCVSPFGVHDLAGNVAEWASDPNGSRRSEPFASVVVGGAWGASAATCRSSDASQAPTHRAATLGFRCCADAAKRQGPPVPDRRRGRSGGGFRPIGAPP